MKNISNTLKVISLAGVAIAFAVVYLVGASYHRADASVPVSNGYRATTTAASAVYGAGIQASKLIKSETGVFGSVVITGATVGVVNFYNATTSDVNKRTDHVASTSIIIASLPANLAAGTYTFDVGFTQGLYLDLVGGTMPTSTVTYRNE